jgi:hypothetical protein
MVTLVSASWHLASPLWGSGNCITGFNIKNAGFFSQSFLKWISYGSHNKQQSFP